MLADMRAFKGFAAIAAVVVALFLPLDQARPLTVQQEGGPAESLVGDLLVATDTMSDPRFLGTVILMVHHDNTGALGLIINRPLKQIGFPEFLEAIGLDDEGAEGDIRIHYGGPVEPERGFLVHSLEFDNPGATIVPDIAAVTSEAGPLRTIATGSGPERWLFALGYAGWAPKQLEGEIALGAWVTVPADAEIVFDEDYEGKWRRAMARWGIETRGPRTGPAQAALRPRAQ